MNPSVSASAHVERDPDQDFGKPPRGVRHHRQALPGLAIGRARPHDQQGSRHQCQRADE